MWATQTAHLYFDAPPTVPAAETHVYTTAERNTIKRISRRLTPGVRKTDGAKLNAIGLLAAWETGGLTHPDGRAIALDPVTGE